MKNNNFELNNYNLQLLQKKSNIYSYLNSKFNKAHFKLANGTFVFALCCGDGIIKTTLNIDYTGDTRYFTLEYPKWVTALQKFAFASSIKLELNKNLLRLSVDGSTDVINLSVIEDDESSEVARKINTFVSCKKEEIISCNHHLVLTPELLANFDMMCSMFAQQSKINCVGISKDNIIYCDRSTIVRYKFTESLDDALFNNLQYNEKYISIHYFTAKLLELVSTFSTDVYFDDKYELLYWGDENTELIMYSDEKKVAYPTDEQYESFLPNNPEVSFSVSVNQLVESLNFFTGFYEGSSWKPILFDAQKDEEIVLNYHHPTAEVKKSLTDVIAHHPGDFSVDSETLGKILVKAKKMFETDTAMLTVYYDTETKIHTAAAGVYATIGDSFEFILCRLKDNN